MRVIWGLVGILALGAGVETAAGQTGAPGLSLGLEGRVLHQVDELVSPLRYSGTTWGPNVRYGFSSQTQLRALSLSLGLPVLTSSRTGGGGHKEEGYRVDFSAGIFQQVAGFREESLTLFLGGELRGDFAYYDHWYTSVESETWVHLFGLLQAGGGWKLRGPWGGEVWQELTFPVGGLVVRPQYQGITEAPGVDWVGVGGVTGFHQSLQLLLPFGEEGRWGIVYDFVFLEYGEPRPVAMTRHGLRLQATVWGSGE